MTSMCLSLGIYLAVNTVDGCEGPRDREGHQVKETVIWSGGVVETDSVIHNNRGANKMI